MSTAARRAATLRWPAVRAGLRVWGRALRFAALAPPLGAACASPSDAIITTASLPDGVVGARYAQTLGATGGDRAYRWAIGAQALPAGLALDPVTGTISGTPTAAGTFPFTVRFTKGGSANPTAPTAPGAQAVRALSIAIGWPPVVLATGSLPGGVAGVAYRAALAATGGDGTYDWTLAAGALPPGLTLDPRTGVLGGRPLAAGSFAFTVRAASAGLSDARALELDLAFPPSNEPPGYVQQSERPFAAVLEDGWFREGVGAISLESDSTAPRSPPTVLRITYPAGFRGGSANGRLDRLTNVYPKVFASIWVRWSRNWQGEPSATNKLVFNWIHGNPAVFLSAEGVGGGPLVPTMRLQNTPDRREYLRPNVVRAAVILRGQWRRWEYQLVANTPGVPDGVVRWWLDGVLVGEYTDVEFAGAGDANIWEYVSINPTWGGTTGTVIADMAIDLDHVYLSGAP